MSAARPNILFISTDQHRADYLGCMGHPVLRTPHLDRLAREGAVCEQAYAANPLCMPSRASVITGRWPRFHGVWCNGVALRETETTLPSLLSAQGYHTAALGKMHFTPYGPPAGAPPYREAYSTWADPEKAPRVDEPYFGFQTANFTLGHGNAGGHHRLWVQKHCPEALDLYGPQKALKPPSGALQSWKSAVPVEAHSSTFVGNITVDYLKKRARDGQPFFAWASFPDPHHPYDPPAPWSELYAPRDVILPPRRAGEFADKPWHFQAAWEQGLSSEGTGAFVTSEISEPHWREIIAHTYGMIGLVDHNVGRILQTLDETGLASDTAVCFFSDHGDLLGSHGLLNKGPWLYDGLIRVPLLWRFPGRIPAGRRTASHASLLDLAATVLEIAGLPRPSSVQGRSLLPHLSGAQPAHRDGVLVEFHGGEHPEWRFRLKVWKERDWKLVHYADQPYGELYDLKNDPGEFVNLWHRPEHAAEKARLTARLLDELVWTEPEDPPKICHA